MSIILCPTSLHTLHNIYANFKLVHCCPSCCGIRLRGGGGNSPYEQALQSDFEKDKEEILANNEYLNAEVPLETPKPADPLETCKVLLPSAATDSRVSPTSRSSKGPKKFRGGVMNFLLNMMLLYLFAAIASFTTPSGRLQAHIQQVHEGMSGIGTDVAMLGFQGMEAVLVWSKINVASTAVDGLTSLEGLAKKYGGETISAVTQFAGEQMDASHYGFDLSIDPQSLGQLYQCGTDLVHSSKILRDAISEEFFKPMKLKMSSLITEFGADAKMTRFKDDFKKMVNHILFDRFGSFITASADVLKYVLEKHGKDAAVDLAKYLNQVATGGGQLGIQALTGLIKNGNSDFGIEHLKKKAIEAIQADIPKEITQDARAIMEVLRNSGNQITGGQQRAIMPAEPMKHIEKLSDPVEKAASKKQEKEIFYPSDFFDIFDNFWPYNEKEKDVFDQFKHPVDTPLL